MRAPTRRTQFVMPLHPVGELAVKGGVLFKEYWNKPEATAESFDKDGYFLCALQLLPRICFFNTCGNQYDLPKPY